MLPAHRPARRRSRRFLGWYAARDVLASGAVRVMPVRAAVRECFVTRQPGKDLGKFGILPDNMILSYS